MDKVALIFGGCGFIGSHLARQLRECGEYRRIVCADLSKKPHFETDGVDYVVCDVREEIPSGLVTGVTEIYNLAAVHTTPGYEDWEYFWTNVLGASHVCDYARRVGVDMIIFTSSISVYGPSEAPVTEASPLNPESAYGQSKLCAETIHHQWRMEVPKRRRLIVVRPAVIFGYTEQGNFTRLASLLKRGAFIFPGRKDTVKACGYVKDLTRSFRIFVDGSLDVVTYNFAYTERFTTEAICEAFHRVAGYPRPKRLVPLPLMMGVGFAFELLRKFGLPTSINRARVTKLIRSTNIVPEVLDRSGFVRNYGLDAALADWRRESGGRDFA